MKRASELFKKFRKRWHELVDEYLERNCRIRITEDEAWKIFEMAFLSPLQFGCEEYHRIWKDLMTDDPEIRDNLNKALMLDLPLLGKVGVQLRPHSSGKPPSWANIIPWTPRYVFLPGHVIKRLLVKEVGGVDPTLAKANMRTAKKLKVFKGNRK